LYTKERTAAIKEILSVIDRVHPRRAKDPSANEETDRGTFARITGRSQVRSKGRAKPWLRTRQPKDSGPGWVQLRLFPLPPPKKPKGPKKK
jgi:hypothetical protein